MKIKIVFEKEIENCNQCPFRGMDGGPGPVMICKHPSIDNTKLENAYIISHPECNAGFPEKCPLLKGKILKEYNKQKIMESKLGKLWDVTCARNGVYPPIIRPKL